MLMKIPEHLLVLILTLAGLYKLTPMAASSFQHLSDLINENVNCTNLVYAFGSSKNDLGVISVPVVFKTRMNVKWMQYLSAFTSIHLDCFTNFFIYPELLDQEANHHLLRKHLRYLMRRENPTVVTHIISADYEYDMTLLLMRAGDDIPYILLHTVQPLTNVILSSLIRYAVEFDHYAFAPIASVAHKTWREVAVKKTRELRQSNQHYYFRSFGESQSGINVSLKVIVSQFLRSPFKYKLRDEYDSVKVVSLLSIEILNSFVGLDEGANYLTPDYGNIFSAVILLYCIERVEYLEDTFDYIIPVGENFMNFVTCDGVGKNFSFEFYLNPYDFSSWLLFAALTFVILPLVMLLLKFSKSAFNKQICRTYCYFLSFNVSTVLEVSPVLPKWISLRPMSRTLIATWLVLVVVLLNAYKGIVVSDLTSPVPLNRKWLSIRETDGFFYVVSPLFEELLGIEANSLVTGHELIVFRGISIAICFPNNLDFAYKICNLMQFHKLLKNLSAELQARKVRLSRYADYCGNTKHIQAELKEHIKDPVNFTTTNWAAGVFDEAQHYCRQPGFFIRTKLQSSLTSLNAPFLNALVTVVPFNFQEYHAIPKMLSACYRNGFIDVEKNVDYVLALAGEAGYTNYKKGEDKMFHRWVAFVFGGSPSICRDLYSSMQKLMASGIYNIWEKWYAINNIKDEDKVINDYAKKRKRAATIKPLALDSNILTCFFILILCVFIATLIIFTEILLVGAQKLSKFLILQGLTCCSSI